MKMLSVKLPRPFRIPRKYIRKSSYAASESRWQSKWQAEAASAVINNHLDDRSSKFYMLSMFPYPSGRLHMGHVRVYTISDTVARFHRMKGRKVLHPMGWDSFGLPAENAAIDRGIHPAQWTEDNISTMRDQLNLLGCQFDWHRELSTCSPDYYKWSQWLFLQLYKNGLAYKKKAYVNWDPVDQTVLANEQVDSDGCSWRSGAKVEQRYLDQWFFKTTHYAEALLQGLDELDWPNQVKLMQADWIGKSQGAYFDFKLQEVDWTPLKVFTTRADTLFGVSYLAISTEHDLLQNTKLFSSSVLQAVEELRNISKIANNETSKKGFPLGLNVIHPLTGDSIPVYVADYVIGDYGTKAVMGVPAHDERDLLFANEHGLPIVSVIDENEGRLVRSEQFSGMFVEEGRQAIIDHAASMGVSGHMTQYKLRDWLISRQRYWGAPIPIVYCEKCGTIPVSEQSLPVMLPSDVKFSGRGPSPLTQTTNWLRTTCGKSGCCARRETDTMDTFVDSSWYFLRYINPDDSTRPFRTEDANIWMPVNVYVGGIEHAILHLIYARFITHFLHDIGAVNVKEPFQKILTQGMVQGRTHRIKRTGRYLQPEELEEARREGKEISVSWEKMSKSKYNGVDPEGIIKEYGADTVRLFMLFKAPSDLPIEWDTKAIAGVHRWLGRVECLVQNHTVVCRMKKHSSGERRKKEVIESAVHKAIKESTIFYEEHKYNKVLPELMILSNLLRDSENGTPEFQNALTTLCVLLAPMAPHFASEMWEHLREAARCLDTQMTKDAVLDQQWPTYRADLLQEDTVLLVITMNGKKVGTVSVPSELTQTHKHSELESKAKQLLQDKGKLRNGVNIERVVVVPDRGIVNFVTKR